MRVVSQCPGLPARVSGVDLTDACYRIVKLQKCSVAGGGGGG